MTQTIERSGQDSLGNQTDQQKSLAKKIGRIYNFLNKIIHKTTPKMTKGKE